MRMTLETRRPLPIRNPVSHRPAISALLGKVMAKIFLLFFLAFTAGTTWAYSKIGVENSSISQEGETAALLKVLYENSTTHDENPHHVSLQATDMRNKHFCGASIISPMFLVSAAHCFEHHRLPYIQAVAGVRNLKILDATAQVRNVTQVHVHEKYNAATRDNDIALLMLNQPLDFDEKYVRPIALWGTNRKLPQFFKVSGWGYRSYSRLSSVIVPVIDHENCTAAWGQRGNTVTSNMICARGYPDACPGDSGGPLACAKDATDAQPQHYLCGIVSWGHDCTVQRTLQYPGVYTDVTKYAVWIKRHSSSWVLQVPNEHKLPAHVPQRQVLLGPGETGNASCETPGGQQVSLCLWQDGEARRLIIIDQGRETAEKELSREDTTYLVSNRLKGGKCDLSTRSVPRGSPAGRWTCLLVTENRTIFTGVVAISQLDGVLRGSMASHGDGPNGNASFPHTVSLQSTTGKNLHFCGASIIHSRVIVSAAHCFKDFKPPHIQAVAGEYDLYTADGTEQVRHVTQLIIHELYNASTWENDIALLVLNESLKFDEQYVRPITLVHPTGVLPDSARVSGWGYGAIHSMLQYATIKIHDHGNCTTAWARGGFIVTFNMICAGGYRDACEGDSGSPLTCELYGKSGRYLCGIVSWGQTCNDRHKPWYPRVYTDIRRFHYWVKRQIRTLAVTVPEILLPAHVRQWTIAAELHASLEFSCETPGEQEVSLCQWWRDGSVVVDQQLGNRDKIIVPGISYVSQFRLYWGQCGIRINSLSEADFKRNWTCILVARDATVYAGSVAIKNKPKIYFTTRDGRIQAYSTLTSRVSTILSMGDNCYGIAYDVDQGRIYWSTWAEYKIYGANAAHGMQVETVLNTKKYGKFQGLAFDWISGNIYIGTSEGYIIVCSKNPTRTFTCVPVININSSSRVDIKQIALNPIQGTMYWTAYARFSRSGIKSAGMDGTNEATIVTGLTSPPGIALDLRMSRLYWADERASKIQSSNLEGRDVRTIIEFPGATPLGMAVIDNRIFWGSSENQELQSSMKTGADIRILHRSANPIRHLAVVPDLDLPRNRTNHCEGQNCPTICVLNPTSFKCF